MTEQHPATDEIRAELERILKSRSFEQAERHKEFLRFVVEETLAGRGDRLKGYTIAIEVFGRPADFDAQSDPLVRVEAGRLRRRLIEYYAGEGASDPVRIELPRGGYAICAVYSAAKPSAMQAVLSPKPPALLPRRVAITLALMAVAVLVGIISLVWRDQPPTRDQPSVPADADQGIVASDPTPRLLVVPFTSLSDSDDLDYFAHGITEEIILRLHNFNLNVIAHYTDFREPTSGPDFATVGAELDVDYVLLGTVRNSGGRVRISARVVDVASGAQLWTEAFDEDLSLENLIAIQESVARQVAAALSGPFGPLYEQEIARATAKLEASLETYDCVLRFYYYAQLLDRAGHGDSLECFNRTLQTGPRDVNAWASLAILYLHEHSYGYNPQTDLAEPLVRATEAARTALDIDGQSPLAHLALAGIRFVSGDLDEFKRTAERFLSLNPPPGGIAQIALLIARAGDWQRGLAMMDDVLSTSPRPPGWYHVPYALHYLRTEDYEQALSWALKIDTPHWFMAPMIVATAAQLADRDEIAQRSVMQLLELYPDFASTGRAQLRKWNLDEELLAKVMDALGEAGLEML